MGELQSHVSWKAEEGCRPFRSERDQEIQYHDAEVLHRLDWRHEQPLLTIDSFFGSQEGDFSLCIKSITALCKAPPPEDSATGIPEKLLDVRQLEEGTASAEEDQSYYSFHVNSGLFGV